MPSYIGMFLGAASFGVGVWLVAGTKDEDPYRKSKKASGIVLIVLGVIMFLIGMLYEEAYDPTSSSFLQQPVTSAVAPVVPGNQGTNVNINVSGSGNANSAEPANNTGAEPMAPATLAISPNGNTKLAVSNEPAVASAVAPGNGRGKGRNNKPTA